MKHQVKHYVEYGALRAIVGLVNLLPQRPALGLGWLLARLLHRVGRKRVLEARRRIRIVFGDQFTDEKVAEIAWLSLRNMVFNAIELMRIPSVVRHGPLEGFDPEVIEQYRKIHPQGRGAVFALPHMGNWDLAGLTAHGYGLPMFFLAASQRNRLVDDWLNRMRSYTGVETISRDSGMFRGVIKNLKKGKILAILPDLRSLTPAMDVEFLGSRANLGGGAALFSRQAGVPIYPVILRRIGWFGHTWKIGDPIFPDTSLPKDEDWQRITQTLVNSIEGAIRTYPDQYFWYNKRWVLDPLEKPAQNNDEVPKHPNTQGSPKI